MRAGFAAELSCSACRAWKPLDGWRLRVEGESNSETSGLVMLGSKLYAYLELSAKRQLQDL